MKLTCCHADTCLSDFWGGHHLPHVCIPVWPGMTLEEIKEELLSELNQLAVAGSFDPAIIDSDEWYHAAVDAIQAIEPIDPQQTTFFDYLDEPDEDGIDVYAYFVFEETEEDSP